ncbi:hypothetical protein CPAR01_09735, partial [Colletotrichum paranaense]
AQAAHVLPAGVPSCRYARYSRVPVCQRPDGPHLEVPGQMTDGRWGGASLKVEEVPATQHLGIRKRPGGSTARRKLLKDALDVTKCSDWPISSYIRICRHCQAASGTRQVQTTRPSIFPPQLATWGFPPPPPIPITPNPQSSYHIRLKFLNPPSAPAVPCIIVPVHTSAKKDAMRCDGSPRGLSSSQSGILSGSRIWPSTVCMGYLVRVLRGRVLPPWRRDSGGEAEHLCTDTQQVYKLTPSKSSPGAAGREKDWCSAPSVAYG